MDKFYPGDQVIIISATKSPAIRCVAISSKDKYIIQSKYYAFKSVIDDPSTPEIGDYYIINVNGALYPVHEDDLDIIIPKANYKTGDSVVIKSIKYPASKYLETFSKDFIGFGGEIVQSDLWKHDNPKYYFVVGKRDHQVSFGAFIHEEDLELLNKQ